MRQEHTTISTDQSGGNGATSTKVGIGTIWYYTHRVRESAESTDSSPGARVIECRLASVSSTAVPYTVDATDLLRIGGAGRGAQIARTEPTPDPRPRRTGMADTSHDSADMPLYAPLCTGLYLRFTTSVRCPSPRALYTYRSAAPCAVPAYMYGPRSRVRIRHSPKKSRPRAAPAAVWDRSRWM